MRLSDDVLAQVAEEGYAVVHDFLTDTEVAAARAALWHVYPAPDDYFADPARHAALGASQFSGIRHFPYPDWSLNRLAFHPDLVDAARRFLGSDDLSLYKIELWAKYAGATDYAQRHHRDFGNHTLVVPRADGADRQLTTFTLLSDVGADDGPTAIVPLSRSHDVPVMPKWAEGSAYRLPEGAHADDEVLVTGPAGTLLLYRTDVLHRATGFGAPGRSRFMLLADYCARGRGWLGRMAWPHYANHPDWAPTMARCTPAERALFGFPLPGDAYWDDETVGAVSRRYPAMDMRPYARHDFAATHSPDR